MTIDRKTRKDVLDWLLVEKVAWAGRLDEDVFLDRIVELDARPSTDGRFQTARQDILQHRKYNDDWSNDWVYSYEPLSLLTVPDDLFLSFLAEMLHPVVRPDTDESQRLADQRLGILPDTTDRRPPMTEARGPESAREDR